MKNFDEYEVGGKSKIVRQKPPKRENTGGRNDQYRRDQRRKIVEGKRSYGEE